jgi:sodium/potassium-transporting ATPase subunit beta
MSVADSLAKNWLGFRSFMWNGETKEFMGRNGKSWAEITVFYVIFFLCLAGWWTGGLYLVMTTFPPIETSGPKHTSYLDHRGPGIHVEPKWEKVGGDYQRLYLLKTKRSNYIKRIAKFMEDNSDVSNFTTADFGDCSKEAYNSSWANNKLCFYVYLNKIFGFLPEGKVQSGKTTPVIVTCNAARSEYESKVNGSESYPRDGMDLSRYPWTKQSGWKPPIVASRVTLADNAEGEVRIRCNMVAANIFIEDDKPNIGMAEFRVKLD